MVERLCEQNIVIVGQQPWDTEYGSNCKDIAIELSKNNRVLYINSPLDRITLIRHGSDVKVKKRLALTKKGGQNLILIKRNLWNYYPDCIVESINWLSIIWIFDALNQRNNKRFASSIKKAVALLNFNNFILFNDSEILKAFYLNDYLNPILSIYYSRDNMIAVNYWRKHGARLEPELIRKSDLCFSNSEYLTTLCRKYNSDSYNVGQGCGFKTDVKKSYSKPESLLQLNKPIIGYVGALSSDRLDISIIIEVAISFPDTYIVLIGQQDGGFLQSKLHEIENVLFLGPISPEEVSVYINAFDVCINPQLVNAVTMGNYPRKIDEYHSFGKPTVSVRTPAMEDFDGLVYLASCRDEFITYLEVALKEDEVALREKRIASASTHTWENSVAKMSEQIHKKLISKS